MKAALTNKREGHISGRLSAALLFYQRAIAHQRSLMGMHPLCDIAWRTAQYLWCDVDERDVDDVRLESDDSRLSSLSRRALQRR